MRVLGITALLFLLGVLAPLVASAENSKAQDKTACTKRELKLKDCQLRWRSYRLNLGAERIAIFNGTWREVEEWPLKGASVEWSEVKLRLLGSRFVLEAKFWAEPKGEVGLQGLHWMVGELLGAKLKWHLSEIVQRRRQSNDKLGSQWIVSEKMEQHRLESAPDKSLSWQVGLRKGRIE